MVEIDGNPWFVSADVCRALNIHLDSHGYVNTTNALRKLAPEEITLHPIDGQKGLPVKCVSESGLYKLVMRSDKAEAKAFQDWVTREVLPSIRKTGAYVTGQPSLQDNPSMDGDEKRVVKLPVVRGNILMKLDKDEVSLERIKSGFRSMSVISESGFYKQASQIPPQFFFVPYFREGIRRGKQRKVPPIAPIGFPWMVRGGPRKTLQ